MRAGYPPNVIRGPHAGASTRPRAVDDRRLALEGARPTREARRHVQGGAGAGGGGYHSGRSRIPTARTSLPASHAPSEHVNFCCKNKQATCYYCVLE
ncbi:hypothetical protein EVAR_77928_1 [Eumeta japonica]|uniref:Uncharacterized protein n=1 Tax=Eumeta variegata TaxID=151549 RepID=A0A4C1XTJ1_EUMVA|nr:hypothetical protein EVAR_77928_1 [Eumeta japonica]